MAKSKKFNKREGDEKADAKRGIKEDSKRDKALDKKRGIKER